MLVWKSADYFTSLGFITAGPEQCMYPDNGESIGVATKKNREICQFDVALREILPPILRRVQEAPLSATAVIITIVAWIVSIITMWHRWR